MASEVGHESPRRSSSAVLHGLGKSTLSWALVALLGIAFSWRLWVAHRAIPSARSFHDTGFYFKAAEHELFSSQIWAGDRSPLPVLVFKGCGLDPERIRTLLTLLSALCFVLLVLAVCRCLGSVYLRPLAAALLFSLGLSRDVQQWNDVILSESLSFSCAALAVAGGLMFLRDPARWRLPLLLSCVAFGLCRDSNAYLLLMLGAWLGVVASIRRLKERQFAPHALVALSLLLIFLVANSSADRGRRWEYPLTNVIVSRILPYPERVRAFEDAGMPHLPGLARRRARGAYGSDPRLEPFRDWVASKGKAAYVRYIASSPRSALEEPTLGSVLGEAVDRYAAKQFEPVLPAFFQQIWARESWAARLGFVFLAAIAVGASHTLRRSPLCALGVTLGVLVYPHALLVWHGDSMEIARHGLQAAFQLQLACALSVLGLADALLRGLIGLQARGVLPWIDRT